jgi:quercetin dioxygenase-like cupin family protein
VTYAILDVETFSERRKPVAHTLGARAIRLNEFENAPGQAGKEHDERDSGQEEIYIPLRGAGVLRVDGDEVPLAPGRYILVSPEATRQVMAGPDGIAYAVVGARVEEPP